MDHGREIRLQIAPALEFSERRAVVVEQADHDERLEVVPILITQAFAARHEIDDSADDRQVRLE
jgi:hypothetical protein